MFYQAPLDAALPPQLTHPPISASRTFRSSPPLLLRNLSDHPLDVGIQPVKTRHPGAEHQIHASLAHSLNLPEPKSGWEDEVVGNRRYTTKARVDINPKTGWGQAGSYGQEDNYEVTSVPLGKTG